MTNACSVSLRTSVGDITIIWITEEHIPKVLRIQLPAEVQKTECEIFQRLSSDDSRLPAEIHSLCSHLKGLMDGHRMHFTLDSLDMSVCSPFQRQVLMSAWQIPRGKVMSYGRLAARIGSKKGARSVGTALAKNPFPLIIPCHRVVRATGELGGFGGGLKLKKTLLEMEKIAFDLQDKVLQNYFLS